jgi:hypothetical protein
LFAPMKAPAALRPDHEPRPSWLTRFRVRWRRLDLDAELAGGADPEQTEELALRAQQLQEPETRQRLAIGIENVFRLATIGPGPGATTALSVAAFDRNRVAANEPGLAYLAEKLRAQGPHGVRGLAMASVLYEDAASPLYAKTDVDKLKPAVRAAIAALEDSPADLVGVGSSSGQQRPG